MTKSWVELNPEAGSSIWNFDAVFEVGSRNFSYVWSVGMRVLRCRRGHRLLGNELVEQARDRGVIHGRENRPAATGTETRMESGNSNGIVMGEPFVEGATLPAQLSLIHI